MLILAAAVRRGAVDGVAWLLTVLVLCRLVFGGHTCAHWRVVDRLFSSVDGLHAQCVSSDSGSRGVVRCGAGLWTGLHGC